MDVTSLSGKTVLVTGAASGIGAAVARRMAADGATVLAVDLDGAGVKALARDVPGVEPIVCDLSDLDAVDALSAEVDVLVNNAGLQHVAPVHEFDPARFSQILTIMLEAPFRLARMCLPAMYEQGWGRVVNISSVHGVRAPHWSSRIAWTRRPKSSRASVCRARTERGPLTPVASPRARVPGRRRGCGPR